jgi:hypothetical protein
VTALAQGDGMTSSKKGQDFRLGLKTGTMIYISCMSITRAQYIEYLIATPKNFTCTNLANHVQHTSHDSITDFLAGAQVTARDL